MKLNPEDQAFGYASSNGETKGMTKREYFIGIALQGVLSSQFVNDSIEQQLMSDPELDEHVMFVDWAIAIADSLIIKMNT